LYTIRLLAAVGGEESLQLIAELAKNFSGIDSELLSAWRLFDRAVFAQRVISNATLEPYIVVKEAEILPYLDSLSSVRSIKLDLPDLVSFTSISACPPALRSGTVTRRARLGIQGIEKLHLLTNINIETQNTSLDLNPLGEMPFLTSISISIIRPIGVTLDIGPLSRLEHLNRLSVLSDGIVHLDISPLRLNPDLTVTLSKSIKVRGARSLHPKSKVLHVD
jgi:hypothetical protein